VTASDTLAWDRGLENIAVLSNTNMLFTDPGIKPGQGVATFPVSVIVDSMDAEITLEIRDRYYAATPAGHADTISLVFKKIPDTLAPNIIYTPRPGTNGSKVDVVVNDIHYFGAVKYAYDRGLLSINLSAASPNIRLLTPVSAFATGDSTMTFSFEIIDTLALIKRDSLCVVATDLYGNRSESCYIYPLQPDTNAPIFTGMLDDNRTAITATVTDIRMYDRGLGSIALEAPVNLDPAAGNAPGLNGTPSRNLSVAVIDPRQGISGTFVVRDLIAEREPTPETELIHAVRIPFVLPAVQLRLDLPMVVERGADIKAAIVAENSFSGDAVHAIRFVANYGGDAQYSSAVDGHATIAVADAGSSLDITCTPVAGTSYGRGDTLGMVIFKARGASDIRTFNITVDPASLKANDNLTTDIKVQAPGDAEFSLLKLPAPYISMAADSLTYINGICQRVLMSATNARSKTNGLSILGVRPQPVGVAAGGAVELDVRDLPAEGAVADLVAADGRKVASFSIGGSGARVTRISIELPREIPAGAYSLQLRTATERSYTKIIVVE
jgi:hypothetical protein